MINNLSLLRLAGSLSSHTAYRHNVIAENIANSDTPGYKARDVSDFSKSIEPRFSEDLRTTRARHMVSSDVRATLKSYPDSFQTTSPNGNSVSIETEMLRMAVNRQDFDRALTTYKSALSILRTSVGRV